MQKTYYPISSVQFKPPPPPNMDLVDNPVVKIEIPLPVFFTRSQNPDKYIVVRSCKAMVSNSLVGDVKFHSDIVRENPFDDYFICFSNELMVKPKKYKWNNTSKTIKIWFTDMRNEAVGVLQYHVDLLLMY
jgi:hypothetical protein